MSFSGVFSLCGCIVTFIFMKVRDMADFTILFEQAVQLFKQQTLHTSLQLSPVSSSPCDRVRVKRRTHLCLCCNWKRQNVP